MYAGSTLTKISGSVMGAHQKIDRIARKHLNDLIDDSYFPNIKQILNFEGNKGPDAIKRKSPSKNEPWHFIDPDHPNKSNIIEEITGHYKELVKSLKNKNSVRAAFEAAWLSHAIVDGLTPAHHYPFDQELAKLRQGEDNNTRSSISKKIIMPGETGRQAIKNNWKMWGPKGLLSTHVSFELGVAALIAPIRFTKQYPNPKELENVNDIDLNKWYIKQVKKVSKLEIYSQFYEHGWTIKLSRQVKNKLAPIIINAVTLIWIKAILEVQNK